MKVTFKHMCDGCYRMMSESEPMLAFKLIDDDDCERIFKGHEGCINEMMDIMQQLYGTKEKIEDDK